jgi:sec-independent protein translocase protein TatA
MTDGLFANPLHWAILLVIVLIIFGPGKLPSVGNALGKSIKEFKKASQDDPAPATAQRSAEQIPAPQMSVAASGTLASVACAACGKENPTEGRFCADCGVSLAKPIEPEVVTAAPLKLACTKCGTENPSTNRFCAHCGATAEQVVSRI